MGLHGDSLSTSSSVLPTIAAPGSSSKRSSGKGKDVAGGAPGGDVFDSKEELREEKERRARDWPKMRPNGARAHVWKYFKIYAGGREPHKAICNLCVESGDLSHAEISYGKSRSSSNLLSHLNCARRPGHKAAYQECLDLKGSQTSMSHFYEPGVPCWHRPLCRFLVQQELSTVECEHFRSMVKCLNENVSLPDREGLVALLEGYKQELLEKVALAVKDQHVSISVGAWRENTGLSTTHAFLNLSWIDEAWNLVELGLDCVKVNSGSREFFDVVEEKIRGRSLIDRVQAFGTGSGEQAITKAGRVLMERGVVGEHVTCASRRLEHTVAVALGGSIGLQGRTNGGRTREAVASARKLTERYMPFSQALKRLEECCALKGIGSPKVLRWPGVENFRGEPVSSDIWGLICNEEGEKRWCWWSVLAMVNNLVRLKDAIRLHEHVDGLSPMLTEEDWLILSKIVVILEPFVETKGVLEDSTTVTSSLVLPLVHDLLVDLRNAAKEYESSTSPSSDSTTVTTTMASSLPSGTNSSISDPATSSVNATPGTAAGATAAATTEEIGARNAVDHSVALMLRDFQCWWGDGTGVATSLSDGPEGQLGGFRRRQLLATALDPRTKILYGVPESEHMGIWELVVMEAADVMEAERNKEILTVPPVATTDAVTPATNLSSTLLAASSELALNDPVLPSALGGPTFVAASPNSMGTISSGAGAVALVGGGSAEAKVGAMGADEEGCVERNPKRLRGFLAFSQGIIASPQPSRVTVGGTDGAMAKQRFRQAAHLEVASFKEAMGISMYDETVGSGVRVMLDPLKWWQHRASHFPLLAMVARRVLATPATQVHSERMFLSNGGCPRAIPRGPEELHLSNLPNIDLLVFLRNTWPKIDIWDKRNEESTRQGSAVGVGVNSSCAT
ncbi:unnamed protein product [Choristocarpus tenellus]